MSYRGIVDEHMLGFRGLSCRYALSTSCGPSSVMFVPSLFSHEQTSNASKSKGKKKLKKVEDFDSKIMGSNHKVVEVIREGSVILQ